MIKWESPGLPILNLIKLIHQRVRKGTTGNWTKCEVRNIACCHATTCHYYPLLFSLPRHYIFYTFSNLELQNHQEITSTTKPVYDKMKRAATKLTGLSATASVAGDTPSAQKRTEELRNENHLDDTYIYPQIEPLPPHILALNKPIKLPPVHRYGSTMSDQHQQLLMEMKIMDFADKMVHKTDKMDGLGRADAGDSSSRHNSKPKSSTPSPP